MIVPNHDDLRFHLMILIRSTRDHEKFAFIMTVMSISIKQIVVTEPFCDNIQRENEKTKSF